MAPFSLYPYIARHCFLPTVKIGKLSNFQLLVCHSVRILNKYTIFSRPQIFVHPKNAKLDLYHLVFHPLKEKCLVWEEYRMMNEVALLLISGIQFCTENSSLA